MPRKKQKISVEDPPASKGRRSKLAKDNNISADQEAELKDAWDLFKQENVQTFEGEKQGVIPTGDIQVALRAANVNVSTAEMKEFLEILDPEDDGYVTYPHFVELCAIQITNRPQDNNNEEEVEKALMLFTKGIDRPITLQDLRLVAKTLREDVSDDVLKAMILEANGGVGISRGVDKDQFRSIMMRTGLLHQR